MNWAGQVHKTPPLGLYLPMQLDSHISYYLYPGPETGLW